jgi:RHS repeat-associated protein
VEVPKRYGYTSKERDEENSMYYYGARYYAAAIARFVNYDPAGLVHGTDVLRLCPLQSGLLVTVTLVRSRCRFCMLSQGTR